MSGISGHLSYSPIDNRHMQFVFGTFLDSLRDNPGSTSESVQSHERALARALRGPDARTIVVTPAGYPDEMIGWAVALPTCFVFAYVRYANRRGRLGHHFGSDMVNRLWPQTPIASVTPAAIWTRAASRMASKGFPARYDIDENEKFLQLAR